MLNQSTFVSRRFLELFKAAAFALLATAGLALADAPQVSTHFSYNAPTATSVGVAGEFNNWSPAPMTKGDNGAWTLDIPLAPGTYGYKFMVNGNDWEMDPANPARKTVGGIENSAVTVTGSGAAPGTSGTNASAPAASPGSDAAAASPSPAGSPATASTGPVDTTFTYPNATAGSVNLVGVFNNWSTTATPMQKDAKGTWTATVTLAPGTYQYKYFVDGAWVLDPASDKQADDGTGNKNSVKVVTAK
ncbi:MAG TPA: isoamylase early set domain-containing protein [Chthoniobacteraceae bacterium]|jgi:1,4-alpha-glucan branching enzyme|nr:isoamylase early set domain-containing protein [Chthoniobacteraceae bacterium]